MVVVAHTGIPGAGPFVATGLFLLGSGVAGAAFWLRERPGGRVLRVTRVALWSVAGACLVLATVMPFLLHTTVALGRPSTSARLEILSPRPGQLYHGDPAAVDVRLELVGGKVVPLTSLHLIPNEGHIHLYLDGSLVAMTGGLDSSVTARPGRHVLRAEFVAVDHGPFHPRVLASLSFRVAP